MPSFAEIRINNFRNIASLEIEPGARLNFIVGENGAGKTSFLEGVSVLCHGKSFRTHKIKNLLGPGSDEYALFAQVNLESGGTSPLGMVRNSRGQISIKFSHERVPSASELALRLPLIVITSESFRLLEGGPKERRKFLDWLVFHVKHNFAEQWRQVTRCYKHRNTLLRRGKIPYADVQHWDLEIARVSELIEHSRREVFEELSREFQILASNHNSEIDYLREVQLGYKSGWREEGSFVDQLREGFERDVKVGYSTLGPHKADILVKHRNGLPANEILSRGQQKTLISTLFFAKAGVYQKHKQVDPMVLVDDLPAELDINNQRYLGAWLAQLRAQVFVSGIDDTFIREVWPDLTESRVFHVKHGALAEAVEIPKELQ